MIRVAINGFGRIGRQVFQAGINDEEIEWVAVNDITDTKTLAYLLKHDSVHGRAKEKIEARENSLVVDGKEIIVLSEKEPEKLPWKELRVDVVIESTGVFRGKDDAGGHIRAGAAKVIISAPAKGDIESYVLGVNTGNLGKSADVIDNASCTTNCLMPVLKVLNDKFKIKRGFMTTIHAYTADQRLVDAPHKDLRRARHAALSIIPTTTGAAKAVAEVIPELKGKLDGIAMRVPVISGSLIDFTFLAKRKTSVEEINDIFKKAGQSPEWQGILKTTEEPLVSTDIIGEPYGAIVDLSLTRVIDSDLVKVFGWYDNEAGYTATLVEHVRRVTARL